MHGMSEAIRNLRYPDYAATHRQAINDNNVLLRCDWPRLRAQLLTQWERLAQADLDNAGPDRRSIAVLVQREYGVSAILVENYLSNLERTLPVQTQGGGYVCQ